jgi:hypothetical protein
VLSSDCATFAIHDQVTHSRSGCSCEVFGVGTRCGAPVVAVMAGRQLIRCYAWNVGGLSYSLHTWRPETYLFVNLPAADFDLVQPPGASADATSPSAGAEGMAP